MFHNSAKAGIRVVVRDHNGTYIATLSQKVRFPHFVETTEAMAVKHAFCFALELGLCEVEFEGDLAIITEALKVT